MTATHDYAKVQSVMSALEAIEVDTTGDVDDILTDAEKSEIAALTADGAAAEPAAESLDGKLFDIFEAEDALAE